MKKSFLASLILHAALFEVVYIRHFDEQNQPPETREIEIKKQDPPKPKPSQEPSKAGSTSEPARISNQGTSESDPGKLATVENYLDRTKSWIEPGWKDQAYYRLKYRQRSKLPIRKCESCVDVTLDAKGTPLDVKLVKSCKMDPEIDRISLKAFDYNLPPPPSSLLENGKLVLNWCFGIN